MQYLADGRNMMIIGVNTSLALRNTLWVMSFRAFVILVDDLVIGIISPDQGGIVFVLLQAQIVACVVLLLNAHLYLKLLYLIRNYFFKLLLKQIDFEI